MNQILPQKLEEDQPKELTPLKPSLKELPKEGQGIKEVPTQ